MKKPIIIVLLLLVCGFGIFFSIKKRLNPNEITLYGNIEIRQVDLSFQVSGKIIKMLKEEGDHVKKGELLAVLDDKDYNLSMYIAFKVPR